MPVQPGSAQAPPTPPTGEAVADAAVGDAVAEEALVDTTLADTALADAVDAPAGAGDPHTSQ